MDTEESEISISSINISQINCLENDHDNEKTSRTKSENKLKILFSKDSDDDSLCLAELIGRSPPTNSSQSLINKSSEDDFNKEFGETLEVSDKIETISKKRGRPRKSITNKISKDDFNEDSDKMETISKKRGRPRKSITNKSTKEKNVDKDTSERNIAITIENPLEHCVCQTCNLGYENEEDMHYHMLFEHGLKWTKQNPEGVEDIDHIFKVVGKKACPKCGKVYVQRKNLYLRHMVFCGRENETEKCNFCKKDIIAPKIRIHKLKCSYNPEYLNDDNIITPHNTKKIENLNEHSKDVKHCRRESAKRAITKIQKEKIDVSDNSDDECGDYKSEKSSISSDNSKDSSDQISSDSDVEDKPEHVSQKSKKLIKDKYVSSDQEIDNQGKTAYKKNLPPYGFNKTSFKNDLRGIMLRKELHRKIMRNMKYRKERLFNEINEYKQDWVEVVGSEIEKYLPENKISDYIMFSEKLKTSPDDKYKQLKLFEVENHEIGCSIFTGDTIWSVAWVPEIVPSKLKHDDSYDCINTQYLALFSGLSPTCNHVEDQVDSSCYLNDYKGIVMNYDSAEYKCGRSYSLIQLWSFSYLGMQYTKPSDASLSLLLACDYAHITAMIWAPSNAYDVMENKTNLRRLGILACASEDGFIYLHNFPFPETFVKNEKDKLPIYKNKPFRILKQSLSGKISKCTCLDWLIDRELNYIIAGYADGSFSIFNLDLPNDAIENPLSPPKDIITPIMTSIVFPYMVTCVKWIPFSFQPTQQRNQLFAIAGKDKKLQIFGLDDIKIPVCLLQSTHSTSLHPSANWTVVFSTNDCLFSKDENTISSVQHSYHGTSINNFYKFSHSHWDCSFSDWNNCLLVCSTNGRLSGNYMKSLKIISCTTRKHYTGSFVIYDTKLENNEHKKYRYIDYPPSNFKFKSSTFNIFKENNTEHERDEFKKSIYKVTFNSNIGSHYWTASGGLNGILRIKPIPICRETTYFKNP